MVAKASNPNQKPDGTLAAQITLAPATARLELTPEEQIERAEIEAQLSRLRTDREEMEQEDYQAAILPLLIQLARVYEAAEARTTKSAR